MISPMEQFVDTSQATLFAGQKLTSSNNLNSITTVGTYYWSSDANAPQNAPEASNSSMLLLQWGQGLSSWVVQIVFTANKIYLRRNANGNWDSWHLITAT